MLPISFFLPPTHIRIFSRRRMLYSGNIITSTKWHSSKNSKSPRKSYDILKLIKLKNDDYIFAPSHSSGWIWGVYIGTKLKNLCFSTRWLSERAFVKLEPPNTANSMNKYSFNFIRFIDFWYQGNRNFIRDKFQFTFCAINNDSAINYLGKNK